MRTLSWTTQFDIYAGSQSAMKLAGNPEYHDRTKHIAVRWHLLRWLVNTKQVDVKYMPTTELVADALTKALPKVPFQDNRGYMNFREKNDGMKI
jgi:hypothetical protein